MDQWKPDYSRLCSGAGIAGNGCQVVEFNVARSDDTAECQHVQRSSFLFLVRSSQLNVMDRGREDVHRVFILCWGDKEVFLHPEYSTEVFIESARTLALRTAGEESASLRLHVPAKH